jgi:hypothetical protein
MILFFFFLLLLLLFSRSLFVVEVFVFLLASVLTSPSITILLFHLCKCNHREREFGNVCLLSPCADLTARASPRFIVSAIASPPPLLLLLLLPSSSP